MAGGGAAPPPKQEELQPHPIKDQLPSVSYCITSPPPWRTSLSPTPTSSFWLGGLGFVMVCCTFGICVLVVWVSTFDVDVFPIYVLFATWSWEHRGWSSFC
jgi:hypothetical protein